MTIYFTKVYLNSVGTMTFFFKNEPTEADRNQAIDDYLGQSKPTPMDEYSIFEKLREAMRVVRAQTLEVRDN